MGIWAEIKHALNSTLGTTSFKPLNTLITDHITTKIGATETNVKSAIGTTETNIKTHTTSEATAIKNLVTSETTGVESHVTTKTNETKTHVTTQVENSKQAILNQLYNSKSLMASEEVYCEFPDALSTYKKVTDASYNTALCSFTMTLSGAVDLLYGIGLGASRTDGTKIEIVVNKNGSQYFTYSTGSKYAGSVETTRLECVRGDAFEIRAIYTHKLGTGNTMTSNLRLHSLNATIVDSETINLQTLI